MAGQAGAVFVQNVTLDAVNVAHDIVMQHKSFQSDRMMTKKCCWDQCTDCVELYFAATTRACVTVGVATI